MSDIIKYDRSSGKTSLRKKNPTVEVLTNPQIITPEELAFLCKKKRTQVDTMCRIGELTHTYIFAHPKTNYKGFKVIVVDEKCKEFLKSCNVNYNV